MCVAERSSPHRLRKVLPALAILLASDGCKKNLELQAGMSPAQQSIIEEAAQDYDIGAERQAIPIRDPAFPVAPIPEASAPHMTIATLTRKSGHPAPAYRLIARIKSDGEYAAMGIHAGMNFIWRSSWDSTAADSWVTKVIPTKPGAPEHVLTRDPRHTEFTTGDPKEPRLVLVTVASVAFATCLDDPMCGSGHCGYW